MILDESVTEVLIFEYLRLDPEKITITMRVTRRFGSDGVKTRLFTPIRDKPITGAMMSGA